MDENVTRLGIKAVVGIGGTMVLRKVNRPIANAFALGAAFNILVDRNGKLAMEALSELGAEKGAELLALRPAEEIARLAQEVPSDDAAALIDHLPEELSAVVLDLIRPKPGGGVSELLEYEEQTAGRLMNPNVYALSEDLTAGEAITALQTSRDVEMVFYLYVVDERRHLVGVVSLRRLLLVPAETPLKRIMTTDVESARVDTDQEEVARPVASYNLLAIPVVDPENKLVGVITVDDVIDVIKDEATEDVYRLAGVSQDDGVLTPPQESLRRRLPWLLVNLVTAFIAASVVNLFKSTFGAVPLLAVLMPIVAGMGGNAATQTLAVIVRGLALGELTWANAREVLLKEGVVGIGNGAANGLVAGLVVGLFSHDWMLGLILAGEEFPIVSGEAHGLRGKEGEPDALTYPSQRHPQSSNSRRTLAREIKENSGSSRCFCSLTMSQWPTTCG
jgi:magnesium transporter